MVDQWYFLQKILIKRRNVKGFRSKMELEDRKWETLTCALRKTTTEWSIFCKCLTKRRLRLISRQVNICQEYLSKLKLVNFLFKALAGLCLLSLLAHKNGPPQTLNGLAWSLLYGACISRSASPLLFLNKLKFLFIWACLSLPPYIAWQPL